VTTLPKKPKTIIFYYIVFRKKTTTTTATTRTKFQTPIYFMIITLTYVLIVV